MGADSYCTLFRIFVQLLVRVHSRRLTNGTSRGVTMSSLPLPLRFFNHHPHFSKKIIPYHAVPSHPVPSRPVPSRPIPFRPHLQHTLIPSSRRTGAVRHAFRRSDDGKTTHGKYHPSPKRPRSFPYHHHHHHHHHHHPSKVNTNQNRRLL